MAEESTPQSEFAEEKFADSQSHFQQASDDLKTAAGAKLEDFKSRASDLKDVANAKLDDLKGVASAKLEDLKGIASAKADEYYATASAKADELRGQAEAAWGDAKVKARTFQEDGEHYVRENPTRAILIGLGAGFLLGLIVRK
jgi:ElaB/YqjD/DUF883 family membrane-anchored ribosome-binding protein